MDLFFPLVGSLFPPLVTSSFHLFYIKKRQERKREKERYREREKYFKEEWLSFHSFSLSFPHFLNPKREREIRKRSKKERGKR
jgi:hypothetical protein